MILLRTPSDSFLDRMTRSGLESMTVVALMTLFARLGDGCPSSFCNSEAAARWAECLGPGSATHCRGWWSVDWRLTVLRAAQCSCCHGNVGSEFVQSVGDIHRK